MRLSGLKKYCRSIIKGNIYETLQQQQAQKSQSVDS